MSTIMYAYTYRLSYILMQFMLSVMIHGFKIVRIHHFVFILLGLTKEKKAVCDLFFLIEKTCQTRKILMFRCFV